MARVIKRNKALSVMPVKSSKTMGAILATMGLQGSIPLLHGAQGCTAFSKIFLIQHFREPMPMQTTAVEQISAVMGADENAIEALKTIYDKFRPDVIGFLSTGLTEVQGSDINRLVKEFYTLFPECRSTAIIPISAPDFEGCLESGFATAVEAMISQLVSDKTVLARKQQSTRYVNVLVSSMLTPGDIEALKDLIELFGLKPIVIPDLADSLDGHLSDVDFSPVTTGGIAVETFRTLHRAEANLTIGSSLNVAAELLTQKTGIAEYRFPHLMTLSEVDRFVQVLADISGSPVPDRLERHRSQLLDAMLDTHFALGDSNIALALDPDLLLGFSELIVSMGGHIIAAVAPANVKSLDLLPFKEVKIGDLQDLEAMVADRKPELIISNSHAITIAERFAVPLYHSGFPQHEMIGGYQRCQIGYRGIRQTLFDLANHLQHSVKDSVNPYYSVYAQKRDEGVQSRPIQNR